MIYLLDLFDGKISIEEMRRMDYSLLLSLKEVKQKSLIEEKKRIDRMSNK